MRSHGLGVMAEPAAIHSSAIHRPAMPDNLADDADPPDPDRPRYLKPGMRSLPHHRLSDPDELLRAVFSRVAPLRDVRLMCGSDVFRGEVAHLAIDQTALISFAGSAMTMWIEHAPVLHLIGCFAGTREVVTPYGWLRSVGSGVFLLPTGAREIASRHSVVVIALEPAAIEGTAAAMAGPAAAAAPPWASRWFEVFRPRNLSGVAAAPVLALLRHIDACVSVDPALPARLGLDDVIRRAAAGLLVPALLEAEPVDAGRLRERDGRSSFDDLIDYIRANLDGPLRLSDLEARSHYSRRALQYAFREKLQATPSQWIREQRLARAMERLEAADGKTTVRAIALACGYRHMGLFSAAFRQRFGVSPSEVRRTRL